MRFPDARLLAGPLLAAAFTLAFAGCGSATQMPTVTPEPTDTPFPEHGIDQTVEIEILPDYSFGPAAVTVEPGNVVRFHVVNTAFVAHDFKIAMSPAREEMVAEVEVAGDESTNIVMQVAGEGETWYMYCETHEEQGEVGAIGLGVTPTVPPVPTIGATG